MRLIDKDNLRKPSKGMFIYQDEFEDDVQHVAFEAYTKDDIEREPTVEAIPVELYEQVKGERDVAIEQLKSLNIELFEKPYRKAIPIEWLKKHKCSNVVDLWEREGRLKDTEGILKELLSEHNFKSYNDYVEYAGKITALPRDDRLDLLFKEKDNGTDR